MEITKQELSLINLCLQQDQFGQQVTFDNVELGTAIKVFDKVLECTEIPTTENGEQIKENGQPIKRFIDSEIEFTSEEKMLIKKYLNKRLWGIQDGKIKLSLEAKII